MSLFRLSQNEILFSYGKYYYTHNGKSSFSGAFEITEEANVFVKLPRVLGTTVARLVIKNESLLETLYEIPLSFVSLDADFDLYKASLPIKFLGKGLYFSYLLIDTVIGKIFGYKDRSKIIFSEKEPLCEKMLQVSVSDFSYEEPMDVRGGVIYHVFVDRFCRVGNMPEKEGSVLIDDWFSKIPEIPEYPGAFLKNNYFYGGNLYGIIEKLDYIKSLGVNIIYLSPIFDSPSNHKYDTSDYMKVDESFGGDKALSELIARAKENGIEIILDGVFNHTGADSIYFNKFSNFNSVGAYQSMDSPYYSWYDFKSHPNEYTSWWGIEILPRINPDIPSCKSYFVGKGGVVEKYAKMGIKGLRLDVVDELSDEFVEDIKRKLDEHNATSLLFGEVWEDGSNKIAYGKRKRYFLGNELDGVMNYPIREGIISYIRDRKTESLEYALTDILNNAPTRIRNSLMNLLGSHDTPRIITALHGISPEGRTAKELSDTKIDKSEYNTAIKKIVLAYTVLATIPGIPSIYYGDEAGLQGYSDPLNRLTYPWGREEKKILGHYKKLGKIRKTHSVYKNGDFNLIALTPNLLIFSRTKKDKVYLTALNNGDRDITLNFSKEAKPLLSGNSECEQIIPSLSSNIYVIDKQTKLQF